MLGSSTENKYIPIRKLTCVDVGPGNTLAKDTNSAKVSAVIQFLFFLTSGCWTNHWLNNAKCTAGPPNAVHPNVKKDCISSVTETRGGPLNDSRIILIGLFELY